MQQQSLAKQLRAFMESRHLSQKFVAKAAKISQSTVSRALHGEIDRQGSAKSKLFIYMQKELRAEGMQGKGKEKVVNAFEAIWDGSEAHAIAIAKIIKASQQLRPVQRSGGDR
jgi:transcriptional regulator with XRE-family HTH domain